MYNYYTDQFQVYSLPGNNDICQREREVDTSDVREIEVKLATGVLHYYQCLKPIDMGHNVVLCKRERERERAREISRINRGARVPILLDEHH